MAHFFFGRALGDPAGSCPGGSFAPAGEAPTLALGGRAGCGCRWAGAGWPVLEEAKSGFDLLLNKPANVEEKKFFTPSMALVDCCGGRTVR